MIQVFAVMFGVVLIVVGVAGFVVPAASAPTSGAPAYNLFHIGFGLVGVIAGIAAGGAARVFLIGFGLIDLYQLVASIAGWFPCSHFRWTRTDDVLHLLVGVALVAVGIAAG